MPKYRKWDSLAIVKRIDRTKFKNELLATRKAKENKSKPAQASTLNVLSKLGTENSVALDAAFADLNTRAASSECKRAEQPKQPIPQISSPQLIADSKLKALDEKEKAALKVLYRSKNPKHAGVVMGLLAENFPSFKFVTVNGFFISNLSPSELQKYVVPKIPVNKDSEHYHGYEIRLADVGNADIDPYILKQSIKILSPQSHDAKQKFEAESTILFPEVLEEPENSLIAKFKMR